MISWACCTHDLVVMASAVIACSCHALKPCSACRREQMQDASKAKAFEAASKAKALVKTWKKPRLSPCQTCLPMELWGLVLQQLLPEACLWDLPAAAQQLCNISLTSKGLYAAVQQQGWPQLCQLLKALPPPAAMQRSKYQAPHDSKGQLPSTPDVVITDPASLCLPELRAACNYLGLYTSGMPPAQGNVSLLSMPHTAHCHI